MSRRDELLDKAVAGGLTQEEARELRQLIQNEDALKDLDQRIKMLIVFGVGAAAGYALPKLLEPEGKDAVLEMEPEPMPQPVPRAPAKK